MLDKVGANSEYLKISDLNINEEYVKVAYIEDSKSGISKTMSGFYTFFIKDCEANIITGNLFNVEDFIKSGLVANKLRRKPVKIRFVTQDIKGRISLLISSIEEYREAFDYKSFIGFLPDAEQNLISVEKVLKSILGDKVSLSREYKDNALVGIYNGKCGGYANLLQMVVYNLIAVQVLPNINFRSLIEVFYIVQDRYYKYLVKETNSDILSTADKMQFLFETQQLVQGHDLSKIITECVSGLCGLSKPEHLYSVLIYKSFINNIESINLANIYSTLVLGGTTQVGELKLTKY